MIVTLYGLVAVSFMMAMYAMEHVHRRFILAFAFGCLLSSGYGFLSGAWPFGLVETIWAVIAFRRFRTEEPPGVSPARTSARPPAREHLDVLPSRHPGAPEPTPDPTDEGLRITSSANPSRAGEPVNFVAHAVHRRGKASRDTVTFGVGLTIIDTVPMDDGFASITISGFTPGRHLVMAIVDGEDPVVPRSAWLEQRVTGEPCGPASGTADQMGGQPLALSTVVRRTD